MVQLDDSNKVASYLIDDKDSLRFVLSKMRDVPNDPPSFYIDAEGHKLGRFGTLDLLQIYVFPLRETFIIDIFTLKQAAFDTPSQGYSLSTLLQSSSISKIIFDVRNDADAIFSHYDVLLDGVTDLQMMEYFEGREGRSLTSLKHCVEHDCGLSSDNIQQWKVVKKSVRVAMTDKDAEYYQRRPLPPNLLQYAFGDVEYLPSLYQTYSNRLTAEAWQSVKMIT